MAEWGGGIEVGSLGADASFLRQGGRGGGNGGTVVLASIYALVVGVDYVL